MKFYRQEQRVILACQKYLSTICVTSQCEVRARFRAKKLTGTKKGEIGDWRGFQQGCLWKILRIAEDKSTNKALRRITENPGTTKTLIPVILRCDMFLSSRR